MGSTKEIGGLLRRERLARRWDVRTMARRLQLADDAPSSSLASLQTQVYAWERTGKISERYRLLYAEAFGVAAEDLFSDAAAPAQVPESQEELDSWELIRRATASDAGSATVQRIEQAVDDLAIAYPGTPPVDLLDRIRLHLRYVSGLLAGRMTLREHRRLLIAGGWLSLLAATCAIDLNLGSVGAARLRTAAELAQETDHSELAAWCVETAAWQALTDGDFRGAVSLSQKGQLVAPRGSSPYIQATAQEARAWARIGAQAETREALARVEKLVSPLSMPHRPEHHFRYDPAKAEAYVATTLSWSGDPAAERHAREVLARLETGAGGGPPRPRRAASARLDLSLALVAADKPDEAYAVALEAVTSGRLVPSNLWRAEEVADAVERQGVPGVADMRDVLRQLHDGAQLSALP